MTEVSITDHYPVLIATNLDIDTNNSFINKVFRDHSEVSIANVKGDIEDFLRYFAQFAGLTIESRMNIFLRNLYRIYDRHCVLRTKQVSKKSYLKPWISQRIKEMLNRKHFLFRQYRRGQISFQDYNTYKNSCVRHLRQAKVIYFKNRFDKCRGDARETWRNIRYVMNNCSNRHKISEIRYKGNSHDAAETIAASFSDYFATIATELDNKIPRVPNRSPLDYMEASNNKSMYVAPSTADEVASVIKSFPTKGCDIKNVPVHIFKQLVDLLSPVISEMFNTSVSLGCFPDCLKIARVVPIFKSGDKLDITNYRPISTLCVMSKIFERLMYRRVNAFLNHEGIICHHQFGFQKGSSTIDAILEFLDYIYNAINEGKYIMPVYLDFSKAFDTVNHRILLMKLNHYGIRGVVLNWFKSYLSNRKQYVSVNDCNSDCIATNMGVSQGSILGPMLFLIYVNDMSKAAPLLNFVHFADDTTVVTASHSEHDLYVTVNSELSLVDRWLKVNRLSLNIKKTKFMMITNNVTSRAFRVKMRNRRIKSTNSIKFLGVMLDNKLRFDHHIAYITGKISRAIGVMNSVNHLIPFTQQKNIYYSFVYPHLTYCVAAWGKASSNIETRMQRIQRRAIRVITKYAEHPHSPVRNILSFESAYKYFISVKLFRVLRERNHEYFHDRILNLQIEHQYRTRFKTNECLTGPLFRKTKCQSSFIYKCVGIWNALPLNVKTENSLIKFKRSLKQYLNNTQAPIL